MAVGGGEGGVGGDCDMSQVIWAKENFGVALIAGEDGNFVIMFMNRLCHYKEPTSVK